MTATSTLSFPVREKPVKPSTTPHVCTVRIGLLGAGSVGQAFLQLCRRERDFFLRRGLDLKPVSALVRAPSRPRAGLPSQALLTCDPLRFMNRPCDVVVEALGGVEPARTLVAHCLKAGIPVVTANKSLLAAHGPELEALAQAHGASLRVEAAALAGVPFIGNLQGRPLAGRFSGLQGVLNGTSNYLLTRLAQDQPLDSALSEAQGLGLAEPDPRNDLSGRDSAEKLILLLDRLSKRRIGLAGLEIQALENLRPADLGAARRLGGVVRPLACAWLDATPSPSRHGEGVSTQAFVGPCFLPDRHPLAPVEGLENGLLLLKGRPGKPEASLFYRGPGAGPDVTAATLLDDLWETVCRRADANGCAPRFPAPDRPPTHLEAPRTSWFLRLRTGDAELDEILGFLADHGLYARASHCCGPTVWLLTSSASRTRVEAAGRALAEAAAADTLALRALEVPNG